MQEAALEKNDTINGESSSPSSLREWVITLIYSLILALFIRTFFLQTFIIPTGSMEPTLRGAMNYGSGDRIIAVTFIYGFRIPFTKRTILAMAEPKRGDVIVFNSENIARLDQRKDYVKRLVGLGGERLRITPFGHHTATEKRAGSENGGHVSVNGNPLEKPAAITEKTYYPAGKYGSREVLVPPDHYFMLGDNALNSRDSRFWGFVPRENIIGKAVAIYWPPKRIGLVR